MDDPRVKAMAERLAELRTAVRARDPRLRADCTGARFTGSHFELKFWEQEMLISYPEFECLDASSDKPLPPHLQAMILYYFDTSDGTPETGSWISFADLPGGRFYNQAFQGYTGNELARAFQDNLEAFSQVAQCSGGCRVSIADAAFTFRALPRVPLLVVYYLGDEDFPSTCQVLFDASAGQHLPTDACAILGSHLTHRLIKNRANITTTDTKGNTKDMKKI